MKQPPSSPAPPGRDGQEFRRDPARRRFLVGAAIGTGMAAQSAMRGGADFLLALSAGRLRCMGAPSLAAMLPFRENNSLVMDFASSEILPRATVPVFFGAAVFDPRIDLADLMGSISEAGFSGVVNFPTSVLIGGAYRQFLEDNGLGFGRELEFLSLAKRHGLASLAYTHTIEEASSAARIGVDMVNIDLGWNMGGVFGVETTLRVDEAALMASKIAREVRSISPQTSCMVEGGPIVNPQQLEDLCRIAKVDGYIGGSTIDRVPSESAMEVVTAAFKAIGYLHDRIDDLERGFHKPSFPLTLWGHAPAVEDARSLFSRLAGTDHPVLIVGEPGTGRRELARALHALGRRKGGDLVTLSCRESATERFKLDLFGCMAGAHPSAVKNRLSWLEIARESSILLDDVHELDISVQRQLVEAIESRRFWRLGGSEAMSLDVRFLAVADEDALKAPGRRLEPRFAKWLGCFVIRVPPLRDRRDDLPTLIGETLASLQREMASPSKSLDPSAYRKLVDYHWPGNLRELKSILKRALVVSSGDVVMPDDISLASRAEDGFSRRSSFSSEKEWLLEGLRHNRFRRGETASYLGISRKTLYNKMRAYGLSPSPGGAVSSRDAARTPRRRNEEKGASR